MNEHEQWPDGNAPPFPTPLPFDANTDEYVFNTFSYHVPAGSLQRNSIRDFILAEIRRILRANTERGYHWYMPNNGVSAIIEGTDSFMSWIGNDYSNEFSLPIQLARKRNVTEHEWITIEETVDAPYCEALYVAKCVRCQMERYFDALDFAQDIPEPCHPASEPQ